MHLCHAEECITSLCFCCSVSDSLSLVQYLSHNLGLTPPWKLAPKCRTISAKGALRQICLNH